mmetsp:Transcript_28439/g.42186  ORF Transcript_28439/g.42186 Transcript_28439/m.42186 type:complete len:344 (-) Transcript_28439:58-1089(-)
MLVTAPLLSFLFATFPISDNSSSKMPELSASTMTITKLLRFAVKGLSGDELSSVAITPSDKTFPDDRRFALFKESSPLVFDEIDPEWLHKENFLCAFSDPEMMAGFQSSYEIVKCEESSEIKRLLTLRRKCEGGDSRVEYKHVLGPVDLNTEAGREELSNFFAQPNLANQRLKCISQQISTDHTHQFGNTSSGIKKNGGDTRTVHLVNAATVRDVEEKFGMKLNAIRFRPNIVVDGLEPWKEFDFVGKRLRIVNRNKDEGRPNNEGLVLKVLSRTVRCAGVGVDPFDPKRKIDIPQMLSKHFPEHGPYLGVYAVVECDTENAPDDFEFNISVGDRIELIEDLV